MQDDRMQCPGCGARYFPALARKHAGCVVVHAPLVVHESAVLVVHAESRHGKYADAEARKKYRRDWAREDRKRKREGVSS